MADKIEIVLLNEQQLNYIREIAGSSTLLFDLRAHDDNLY